MMNLCTKLNSFINRVIFYIEPIHGTYKISSDISLVLFILFEKQLFPFVIAHTPYILNDKWRVNLYSNGNMKGDRQLNYDRHLS